MTGTNHARGAARAVVDFLSFSNIRSDVTLAREVAPPPLPELDFEHYVAANEYGFYCVPLDFAGRELPRKLGHGMVYESATLAFLRRKIGRGDVVTGGAFIGDFLPALHERLHHDAVIHSFEPHPVSCAAAAETIRLNELERVRLHPVAVADAPGTLPLQISRNQGASSLAAGARIVEDPEDGNTLDVEVTTIDALVPGDRGVTLLHLDVQGSELKALKGAQATIRRCAPIIVLEAARRRVAQFYLANLTRHFPELGYRIGGRIEHNCVFIPAEYGAAP